MLAVLALMLPLLVAPVCAVAATPPADSAVAAHCHNAPEDPTPDEPAGADAPDCCPACAPAQVAVPPSAPTPQALTIAVARSRPATADAAPAFAPPCPPARGPPAV